MSAPPPPPPPPPPKKAPPPPLPPKAKAPALPLPVAPATPDDAPRSSTEVSTPPLAFPPLLSQPPAPPSIASPSASTQESKQQGPLGAGAAPPPPPPPPPKKAPPPPLPPPSKASASASPAPEAPLAVDVPRQKSSSDNCDNAHSPTGLTPPPPPPPPPPKKLPPPPPMLVKSMPPPPAAKLDPTTAKPSADPAVVDAATPTFSAAAAVATASSSPAIEVVLGRPRDATSTIGAVEKQEGAPPPPPPLPPPPKKVSPPAAQKPPQLPSADSVTIQSSSILSSLADVAASSIPPALGTSVALPQSTQLSPVVVANPATGNSVAAGAPRPTRQIEASQTSSSTVLQQPANASRVAEASKGSTESLPHWASSSPSQVPSFSRGRAEEREMEAMDKNSMRTTADDELHWRTSSLSLPHNNSSNDVRIATTATPQPGMPPTHRAQLLLLVDQLECSESLTPQEATVARNLLQSGNRASARVAAELQSLLTDLSQQLSQQRQLVVDCGDAERRLYQRLAEVEVAVQEVATGLELAFQQHLAAQFPNIATTAKVSTTTRLRVQRLSWMLAWKQAVDLDAELWDKFRYQIGRNRSLSTRIAPTEAVRVLLSATRSLDRYLVDGADDNGGRSSSKLMNVVHDFLTFRRRTLDRMESKAPPPRFEELM